MSKDVTNNKNDLSWLKKLVFNQLATIKMGSLVWQDGKEYHWGQPASKLQATITIHHDNFYRKFFLRGSVGAAESYMAGDWDCDNLTTLIQIVLANEATHNKLERGWPIVSRVSRLVKNLLMCNSIANSRKNIYAHYDLSNEFFSLFLDKYKMYSCALFSDDKMDLEAAQKNKLTRICDQLELNANDHLLEIGSGWGGLAIFAVQHYGCKVTTTTISAAQYHYVKKKVAELGLMNQITILNKDYRELIGHYDKLVSIEMIEAVGHRYFKKFFVACDRLLKKNGKFFLQTITIKDSAYDNYKHEIDFIKAYIFPGGCLPCIAVIAQAVKAKTEMRIYDIKDIGFDYAQTLRHWCDRLLNNVDAIKQLGFNQQFIRMFEFYFCYCQAGFLSGHISDVQILMVK